MYNIIQSLSKLPFWLSIILIGVDAKRIVAKRFGLFLLIAGLTFNLI